MIALATKGCTEELYGTVLIKPTTGLYILKATSCVVDIVNKSLTRCVFCVVNHDLLGFLTISLRFQLASFASCQD